MVTFPGFVDCVYLDASSELQLDNGLGDLISINNTKYAVLNVYYNLLFDCPSHMALPLTHVAGQMLCCGILIFKWKHVTKILFALKMLR